MNETKPSYITLQNEYMSAGIEATSYVVYDEHCSSKYFPTNMVTTILMSQWDRERITNKWE